MQGTGGRIATAHRHLIGALAALAAVLPLCIAAQSAAAAARPHDLAELSLEELMNVEVISATRFPKSRFDVADAIYVITQDDIRRSGATTIADALRLAPGVHVARIDSNTWAVGIRGFASSLARSVLVLIDGRTVYSPLTAGTYWAVQDTLLEDIDRIEVIRGPAGTLWGENAVNGVINIVTKKAADTQGVLLSAGGGNEEQGFGGARYGGRWGDGYYRVYGKYFNRDGGISPAGDYDGWHMGRAGFRADRPLTPRDGITVQGDIYSGDTGGRGSVIRYTEPFITPVEQDTELAGGNLLGRWAHQLAGGSDIALQVYYDQTYRREINFREDRHTGDLDFQHRLRLPWRQRLIWGLGYRITADNTASYSAIAFIPDDRTDNLLSGFIQDDIRITDDVSVIIGTKLSHNDYSGVEVQPSGRILWTPSSRHSLWAGISRAVRSPARSEHDISFTGGPTNGVFPRIVGTHTFDSETVVAYEGGYRLSPMNRLYLDLTVFYQDYENLLSLSPGAPFTESEPPPPHTVFPLFIANNLHGSSHGFEVAADLVLTEWWRLNISYSYLSLNLGFDPGVMDVTALAEDGSSPGNMVSSLSKIDLPWEIQLDTFFRYVDSLPAQRIAAYATFDVRLAKRLGKHLELSAVGQNLGDARHHEFGNGTALERSAYGQVRMWW